MSSQNAILSQLRLLKLSDGARVVDSATRVEKPSANNMSSTLRAFIAEHNINTANVLQTGAARTAGNDNNNNVTTTTNNNNTTNNNDNYHYQSHKYQHYSNSNDNKRAKNNNNSHAEGITTNEGMGGCTMSVFGSGTSGELRTSKTRVEGGGGYDKNNTTSSNANNNNNSSGGNSNNNDNSNNNNSGGGGGGRSARLLRATPRSQQQQQQQQQQQSHGERQHGGANEERSKTPATTSVTLEELRKMFPITTISTPADVTAAAAVAAAPPVVIAPLDVEPSSLCLSTVVAGDAANPKLLEQIDNFGAEKPIIRTAPSCKGRYIIVGDIHGCPKQLEELMQKVNYQKGKDCLILAGDLVNKGPDSVGAVELAQKLGAIGVLGNHDSTLLYCISRSHKGNLTLQEESDPVMRLATSFPQSCQRYLRSLPHILRIPSYNVVVVHAGFNLNNPITNQNVFEIMHMRRLEKLADDAKKVPRALKQKWRVVVKGSRGEPWGKLWEGPEHVVFGHDARSGLQKYPFSYGIDTGCVYGHELTCVIYGPDSPKGELVSVPGLPKLANEERGLPPPAAHVYEQYMEELERQILRPTSRATPSVSLGGNFKPTFLAAPPTGSPLAASGALGGNNDKFMRFFVVEQTTLLSLSMAGELRSINTLMNLPLYESAWLSLLNNSDTENNACTFWIPFVRGIFDGLLTLPAESTKDYADDVLQLALEACDEIEAVRKQLAPQLRLLVAHEEAGTLQMSKATAKSLRLFAACE